MKRVIVCGDVGLDKCPPQRGPMKSKARFVVMVAGTRGGKSRTAAKKFFARILRDHLNPNVKCRIPSGVGKDRRPRLHYWVVAPTADLLKEPKRYLFETIPPEAYLDPLRPINHENQMWLKGDILIEFRSADNPFRLVSVGLNGMWLDEAARIKAEAWVGNLYGRLTDFDGWALFSSTPLGQNWLYEELYLRGLQSSPKYDPSYASFLWHTADNLTISRDTIDAARKNMPPRYFKREYEADFSAFLGNVYDQFDERAHVISEAQLRYAYGWGMRPLKDLFKRVVAGVDWGWTSPGAIVVVGDTGSETVIIEESYAEHRILFDPRQESETWIGHAKRLREKWNISAFIPDPSRPQDINEFVRSGLPVQGAINDVGYGIRRVSEQLHLVDGKPKLRILDTCKNLIREKRSYVWASQRGSETVSDDAIAPNQSDHALDAERYAVVDLVRWEAPRHSAAIPRATGRPIG